MATTTTRLGLTKPASTDLVDVAVLNTNFDKTDAAAGAYVCTSTTRPATPYAGQIIYETDTDQSFVWDSATSTWNVLVPGATVCTSSSRPGAPVAGQTIYETDTKMTYVYASGAWAPVINTKAVGTMASIEVADATARDALFTSPAQGDRVFRTDRQCEEIYFGLYNVSTNVSGAAVAGWYPAPNQAVFSGTATKSTVNATVETVGATGYLYTELADAFGWHSTSTNTDRITPNVAGIYRVTATVAWGTGATGIRRLQIAKNGVSVQESRNSASVLSTTNTLAYVVAMNGSSDYLNLNTYQDNATSLTSNVAVTVEYIRPTIA